VRQTKLASSLVIFRAHYKIVWLYFFCFGGRDRICLCGSRVGRIQRNSYDGTKLYMLLRHLSSLRLSLSPSL